MELRTPATSEGQNLGSSTARYDPELIFNYFEGKSYVTCEVQGNYLYTVGLSQLTIFNISVPSAMVKIATLDGLGMLSDLDIEGNFAYLTSEAFDLVVVNISDPSSPQQIGSYSGVSDPYEIEIVGNIAYMGYDQFVSPKLAIVNITAPDPLNFTVIQTASTGFIQDLEIVNDVAYLCGGRLSDVVRRYNITNPSSPVQILPWLNTQSAMAIKVVGDIAYVATEFTGLYIYNLTNPTSPVQVGSYVDVGGAYDVDIQSNLAFIADGFDGLEVLDISNPATPQKVGHFTNDKACLVVRVSNDIVYLLHGNGFMYDSDAITTLQLKYNVLHPESVGQAVVSSYNIDVKDDIVITTDMWLNIYNVSEPTNPSFVCDYFGTTPNIYNIKIDGNLAYILRTTGTEKLQILNISDPSSPIELGGYEHVMYDSPIQDAPYADMEIHYPLLFIRTPPELLILNVSNPSSPTKLANYSVPGYEFNAMAVHGNLVYLTFQYSTVPYIPNGISVVNISNPALPVEIYNTTSFTDMELVIDNNLLYSAGIGSGFRISNISNPTNIVPIASYVPETPSGTVRTLVVDAGFAYLSSDPKLVIVNVSDPFTPEYLGESATGDLIFDLAVQGDYVYAAYISEGFKVIRIDEDTDFDGIVDCREVYELHTNPISADSDQDGLSDGAELNTYNTDPLDGDSDSDGLGDGSEILTYGTNPKINDTDSDGIYDQEEVIYGVDGYITDPNLVDTDGDGIEDQEELLSGLDTFITNPISNDTDGDGMTDGWEVQYNLTPTSDLDASQDPDGDHVTNLQEFNISSNPTTAIDNDSDLIADDWELYHGIDNPLSDHDNDSLTALQEFTAGTHPHSNDTDGDTMDDFWEVFYGINPLIDDRLGDPDNDELINLQEYYWHTDPTVSDTDGDGFKDGVEVSSETDPLDSTDHPPLPNYWLFIILIIIIGTIATLLYLRSTGRLYRKAPINVFISHAVPDFKTHKVRGLAKRIRDLKAVNRSFYCEEDLQFNIDEWIKETVPLSQVLIFIATENSLKSKDCAKELRLAKKNNLFIIPLKDRNLDWENLKIGRTKLSREFGFTYNPKKASRTFKEISAYISKFKEALDELYVETRKSKEISFQKLEATLDLSEDQIRKLVDTLDKLHRIKGAWNKNKTSYLPEKEIKRRVKAIADLHLTDSVTEVMEKADLHPDSKDLVERFLKVKKEKEALSQKIDMLAPYKTD